MMSRKLNRELKIIKDNNKDSVAVFDFDYTLTLTNSNSSIGVFTNYLPTSYKSKKKRIDFVIDHINNKHVIKLMWWLKIKLLSKYYSNEVLKKIIYKEEFHLNTRLVNILNELIDNGVNIIIYSSGMKQIIMNVLEINNIDIKKIRIIANDIDIESKKIKSDIITPKNKKLNDNQYSHVILFGDRKEDLGIIKKASKFIVKDEEIKKYEG